MNQAIDTAYQTSCRHDLLLRLTQVRDLGVLNRTFVAIVSDLFPDHELRLYDYNRRQRCWQPALGLPEWSDDHDVLDLLHKVEPLVVPATQVNGYRNLYPIASERQLLAGLVIVGEPESIERSMLQVLLNLYANQYFILSRSKRDGLTDLLNRQALNERLQRIFREDGNKARRAGESQATGWQVALLDIDHFKHINDSYGHLCGDEVLVRFSDIMHESFRDNDHLFRYGGEEFVVLLKNVDSDLAHTVLNRFRERIAAAVFPRVGSISVSIGHAQFNASLPPNVNIARADEALYAAKGSGRNQVFCYERLGRNC